MLHARATNIRCDKYCSNFLEIGVELNTPKERITIMVGGGTYFQIFILIYALFFVQI